MVTMLTRNSYAAGNFELRIDGCAPTAYVKSIGGGWSRANIGNEAVGSHSQRIKHITSVEIEPITVEFGLAGAKDMLRWIQGSWKRKDDHRRGGQITYADFDMRAMFEHQFDRALITETTFPTLDGASKQGGYLKCKLQPESVVTTALAHVRNGRIVVDEPVDLTDGAEIDVEIHARTAIAAPHQPIG